MFYGYKGDIVLLDNTGMDINSRYGLIIDVENGITKLLPVYTKMFQGQYQTYYTLKKGQYQINGEYEKLYVNFNKTIITNKCDLQTQGKISSIETFNMILEQQQKYLEYSEQISSRTGLVLTETKNEMFYVKSLKNNSNIGV